MAGRRGGSQRDSQRRPLSQVAAATIGGERDRHG
jgi:hypothetical protein